MHGIDKTGFFAGHGLQHGCNLHSRLLYTHGRFITRLGLRQRVGVEQIKCAVGAQARELFDLRQGLLWCQAKVLQVDHQRGQRRDDLRACWRSELTYKRLTSGHIGATHHDDVTGAGQAFKSAILFGFDFVARPIDALDGCTLQVTINHHARRGNDARVECRSHLMPSTRGKRQQADQGRCMAHTASTRVAWQWRGVQCRGLHRGHQAAVLHTQIGLRGQQPAVAFDGHALQRIKVKQLQHGLVIDQQQKVFAFFLENGLAALKGFLTRQRDTVDLHGHPRRMLYLYAQDFR